MDNRGECKDVEESRSGGLEDLQWADERDVRFAWEGQAPPECDSADRGESGGEQAASPKRARCRIGADFFGSSSEEDAQGPSAPGPAGTGWRPGDSSDSWG